MSAAAECRFSVKDTVWWMLLNQMNSIANTTTYFIATHSNQHTRIKHKYNIALDLHVYLNE